MAKVPEPEDRDLELRDPRAGYEPPAVERLGTVAELTLGGLVGPDDGLGGAGDQGSLP